MSILFYSHLIYRTGYGTKSRYRKTVHYRHFPYIRAVSIRLLPYVWPNSVRLQLLATTYVNRQIWTKITVNLSNLSLNITIRALAAVKLSTYNISFPWLCARIKQKSSVACSMKSSSGEMLEYQGFIYPTWFFLFCFLISEICQREFAYYFKF